MLVLDLGGPIRVAELALVPGYAKTDAADGTDRYAENRRITAVRWRFDDGTTVEQELDPDPSCAICRSCGCHPGRPSASPWRSSAAPMGHATQWP